MKITGFLLILIAFAFQQFTFAQPGKTASKKAELMGNLSFDISSGSGAVRSVVVTIGDGGTGAYKAVMVGDTGLTTHTIFRPADLSPFGSKVKLPIVAFANGGCRNSSGEFRNFLSDIASQGFLVISIGPVANTLLGGGEMATGNTESKQLLDAVDWAIAENNRLGSKLFQKVDIQKVAVLGQSCGGLQALAVSNDPRITTTIILNSGLFSTPPVMPTMPNAANNNPQNAENRNTPNTVPTARKIMPSIPKSDLKKLHAPIAYFTGGDSDMATANAADDMKYIDQVPALHARYDFSEEIKKTGNIFMGHYPATYRQPNGGDFAKAAGAWLKWQLKGDTEAAKMFTGTPCGLEKNPKWSIVRTNIQ